MRDIEEIVAFDVTLHAPGVLPQWRPSFQRLASCLRRSSREVLSRNAVILRSFVVPIKQLFFNRFVMQRYDKNPCVHHQRFESHFLPDLVKVQRYIPPTMTVPKPKIKAKYSIIISIFYLPEIIRVIELTDNISIPISGIGTMFLKYITRYQ